MNAKPRPFFFFILIASAIVGLKCSSSPGDSDGDVAIDGDAAGEGLADTDVDMGGDGDAATDTDIGNDPEQDEDADGTCDSREFAIAIHPVRVMILLDESSSMRDGLPWLPSTTKWQEVAAGLQHLFETPATREFSFGLDAFPDGTLEYFEDCYMPCCPLTCPMDPTCQSLVIICNRSCSVDLPPVVPMDRSAISGPAILDYMNLTFLPGMFASTPLLRQMEYYLADHSTEMPDFYSGDGGSYLLVVSDGEDTCDATGDPPDPTAVIASLGSVTAELLATHNIRTLAVGLTDRLGTAADELNAIASNGGTAFTEFFAVNEAGALEAALDTISSGITSCIFDVEDPDAVAEPEAVNFYFDGEAVVFDDTCVDGWRWTDDTHLQVEFCGPACDMISGGGVEDIEARFGCPTILP